MSRKKRRLDWLGAILGVCDVKWTEDFPDDGYRDVWGRTPLDEPLYLGHDRGSRSSTIFVPRMHTPRASGK